MKNNSPSLSKRLYTIREAATYLGLGVWGVRELVWGGKLPHIRFGRGGKILLDIEDLNALIQKSKRKEGT